eukprot:TRINITY_DN74417_c0_g1_i2.p1 TRINITY_DN74417_c0_g1~~TRINITY_DN74417_c0_g1_i2.p1  ORF type:complete len:470 (-),score=64.98 TRINITY_DN74417_c0_g1_i2:39-1448(-)
MKTAQMRVRGMVTQPKPQSEMASLAMKSLGNPVPVKALRLSCPSDEFDRCLSELRLVLAGASRPLRHEAIEALSVPLRRELLRLMERKPRASLQDASLGLRLPENAALPIKPVLRSVNLRRGLTAAAKDGRLGSQEVSARKIPACAPTAPCIQSADLALQHVVGLPRHRRDGSNRSSGLWTVATPRGHYMAARLTLGGVAMASRTTRSAEEARRLQLAMHQLRETACGDASLDAMSLPSDEHNGDAGHLHVCFERSLRQAVASADHDLGLTFRIVLDLRRWVGKKVQSQVFSNLEDALAMRKRLREVASGGWPALRREWVSWMTLERRGRWHARVRSQDQAEAVAAAAEAAFAAGRENLANKGQKRCAAMEARSLRAQERARQRAGRKLARASTLCAKRIKKVSLRAERAFRRVQRATRRRHSLGGTCGAAELKSSAGPQRLSPRATVCASLISLGHHGQRGYVGFVAA